MDCAGSENKMKIPKVIFYYSTIYDEVLSGKPNNYKRTENAYKAQRKFQKYWDNKERKILTTMSKISGFKWHSEKIVCYLSYFAPFSYSAPLTLKIRDRKGFMFTLLVHELCHVLYVSNKKKMISPKTKKGIYKKYSKERFNTLLHLSVEALLKLTIEKVFKKDAEKYLKYERTWEFFPKTKRGLTYKRSWEIMVKEGPENILKEAIK